MRRRTAGSANSSLSKGRAGTVRGGDRLPWVRAALSGGDNYAPLTSLDWQVHVYGEARPQLRAACEAQRLPLHVFQWRPETRQVGLRRHAAYLVRPDGYVALADPEGSATALTSYLTRWNISCGHERPPIAGQPPAEAASGAE
jgi:hypothetical protein